jgi:hypothetical protein
MPKIGCGCHDRLEWDEVLEMIRELYQGTDVQITIYHYEDNSKGGKESRSQSKFEGNYVKEPKNQKQQERLEKTHNPCAKGRAAEENPREREEDKDKQENKQRHQEGQNNDTKKKTNEGASRQEYQRALEEIKERHWEINAKNRRYWNRKGFDLDILIRESQGGDQDRHSRESQGDSRGGQGEATSSLAESENTPEFPQEGDDAQEDDESKMEGDAHVDTHDTAHGKKKKNKRNRKKKNKSNSQ